MLFVLFTCIAFIPQTNKDLSVEISGLRNNKGTLLVSLFRNGDGFPDDPAKAIRKTKLTMGESKIATTTFNNLPSGNYAVVVLHDENDNLRMDKNWVGLPKEGYGFSNNARGAFGPPGFRQASFSYTGAKDTTVTLRLRY
jgi:uncharacterized protein (DUF2141 family)